MSRVAATTQRSQQMRAFQEHSLCRMWKINGYDKKNRPNGHDHFRELTVKTCYTRFPF